jgi:hypothetical protein
MKPGMGVELVRFDRLSLGMLEAIVRDEAEV